MAESQRQAVVNRHANNRIETVDIEPTSNEKINRLGELAYLSNGLSEPSIAAGNRVPSAWDGRRLVLPDKEKNGYGECNLPYADADKRPAHGLTGFGKPKGVGMDHSIEVEGKDESSTQITQTVPQT